MNNTIKKKKVFKKWVRVLFVVSILIVALASCVMILNGFKKVKINNSNIIYSYNTKENIDYSVNLYENSFIDKTTLGENEMYISDLVRNIESNFSYTYSSTDIAPLKYEYTIVATINGKYKLNSEDSETQVWKKEYVLKEPVSVEISDKNSFSIKENVNIDYNFFNQVVSDFRKELKLSITSSLNVKMKVNVTSSVYNVDETKELYVEIPLNQQAFEIEEHYQNNNSKTIYESNNNLEIGKKRIIIGILILFVDIFLFFNLYSVIFNKKKKNYYNVTLNKILREYGEIIVEVVNPVLEEDLNIIEVKSFNEMVDLEEELRIPMMFYEKVEDYLGEFIIVHNNILYKFVLSNDMER